MEIRSYKDLLVWQRGMDLVELIYQLTKTLPASEQWGLIRQMRNAAISIPSNIAEGYGRQSTGSYKQFLAISRGSLCELETQVILCERLNYLGNVDTEKILDEINQINKLLSAMISKIK